MHRRHIMLPLSFVHEGLKDILDPFIGDSISEMVLRAALVYVFSLVLVRAGKSRMLSQATVFDIILMFILGSMLSRTINGSTPLLPSLAAATLLVVLHYVLALGATHTRFGDTVKGHPKLLIKDGEVIDDALHKHHLTQNDLEEALYQNGQTKIEDVKLARLERNGNISIVPMKKVYTIEVKEGVQTIRIET